MRCFSIMLALGLFACKSEENDPNDADNDGVVAIDDCDDNDANRFPGNKEICNGIDDDCDGFVDAADEGISQDLLQSLFVDSDLDGYGGENTVIACLGAAGTSDNKLDCDDENMDISPGAVEICNGGVDDDCDGMADDLDSDVDEASTRTFYVDSDSDGYGDNNVTVQSCVLPEGAVAVAGDCADMDAEVNPRADEVCDRVDNNCDGLIDDADPNLSQDSTLNYFADADGDGVGDPLDVVSHCEPLAGRVRNDLDCDDSNAAVNPNANEVCDGIDNDCDPLTDENDLDEAVQYIDADFDGYGASPGWWGESSPALHHCTLQPGYSFSEDDCDDTRADVHPGANEVCDDNFTDEDCDFRSNDNDPSVKRTRVFWIDEDGDGYGDPSRTVVGCGDAKEHVLPGVPDCEVLNPRVHPGRAEECNGYDDNCDGEIDEVGAFGEMNLYADLDGDGWGGELVGFGCVDAELHGEPGLSGDCDDNNPQVHPEVVERCDPLGVDEDCNGLVNDEDPQATQKVEWWLDLDGDLYGDPAQTALRCAAGEGYILPGEADCDDSQGSINPGMDELCDDGFVDEDCDGVANDVGDFLLFLDLDGDGYGDPDEPWIACEEAPMAVSNADDCDDSNAAIHPGAQEICDPLNEDEDCSGSSDDDDVFVDLSSLPLLYEDFDLDGYGVGEGIYLSCDPPEGYAFEIGDCDDADPDQSPGAPELCDGVDNDCDNRVDDADDDVAAIGANYWQDLDEDGQGATYTFGRCLPTVGYVSNTDDCDDDDVNIFTGAPELCDGISNDCANTGWVFEDEPPVTHVLDDVYTPRVSLPTPLRKGVYHLCSDVETSNLTDTKDVSFFGHGEENPLWSFNDYHIFEGALFIENVDLWTSSPVSMLAAFTLNNSDVTGGITGGFQSFYPSTVTNSTLNGFYAEDTTITNSVFEGGLNIDGVSTITGSSLTCYNHVSGGSNEFNARYHADLTVKDSTIDGCGMYMNTDSSIRFINSTLIDVQGIVQGSLYLQDSTLQNSFSSSVQVGGIEFLNVWADFPLDFELIDPVSTVGIPYTFYPEPTEPFNLLCSDVECVTP